MLLDSKNSKTTALWKSCLLHCFAVTLTLQKAFCMKKGCHGSSRTNLPISHMICIQLKETYGYTLSIKKSCISLPRMSYANIASSHLINMWRIEVPTTTRHGVSHVTTWVIRTSVERFPFAEPKGTQCQAPNDRESMVYTCIYFITKNLKNRRIKPNEGHACTHRTKPHLDLKGSWVPKLSKPHHAPSHTTFAHIQEQDAPTSRMLKTLSNSLSLSLLLLSLSLPLYVSVSLCLCVCKRNAWNQLSVPPHLLPSAKSTWPSMVAFTATCSNTVPLYCACSDGSVEL